MRYSNEALIVFHLRNLRNLRIKKIKKGPQMTQMYADKKNISATIVSAIISSISDIHFSNKVVNNPELFLALCIILYIFKMIHGYLA